MMNLYIRYFDQEHLSTSLEDAFEFISTFEGFNMTDKFQNELRSYLEGDTPYPKRYKVRTRVYFIVIKTMVETLEAFKSSVKAENVDVTKPVQSPLHSVSPAKQKENIQAKLNEENPGWYNGTLMFKRVIVNPETGKFAYVDTTFSVRTKAYCGQDCYDRMIAHLQSRPDIDPRSQFPAARGKNFTFEFLGLNPEPLQYNSEPKPVYMESAAPILQDIADDFYEDE